MKINRIELLNALEIVKPGLASRELIEQTTSFAFMEGKVVTFNNEISLSFPVEGLDITGAIQADMLYKLLSKLKKDEIEIELTETQILISCGNVKAGVALQKEIVLPLEEIGDIGKFKSLPENFNKALQFSLHAASSDYSRPLLTCIHINKEGYVEATDNFRACKYELKGRWNLSNTLIPASSVREILEINPSNVAEGKGWVHFTNEQGCLLSCRVFDEDKFIDIEKILSNKKGRKIVFPNSILKSFERAELFTDNGVILIDIKDNKIKISSKNETAWLEEVLNIRFNEDLRIAVTPRLINDILSVTKEGLINDTIIKFTVPNEFEYLISLAKRGK